MIDLNIGLLLGKMNCVITYEVLIEVVCTLKLFVDSGLPFCSQQTEVEPTFTCTHTVS